jgi:hypothetical protein
LDCDNRRTSVTRDVRIGERQTSNLQPSILNGVPKRLLLALSEGEQFGESLGKLSVIVDDRQTDYGYLTPLEIPKHIYSGKR